MPVHNIVDKRTKPYDIHVHVVFEACHQDNCCRDATQFPVEDPDNPVYYGIGRTTVCDAIRFAAQHWPTLPVTMYLYDPAVATQNSLDADTLDDALNPVRSAQQ